MKGTLSSLLLLLFAGSPAFADIYTWTGKDGATNVSNLPPPEGTRVLNVTRAAPRDPVREAASREAARQAEVRALDERVAQLAAELEQTRREPPPPVVVMAPPAYAPPPAPYIVNVVTQAPPSYPPQGGCDYGWGNCGFGLWPGYYPVMYPIAPFGRGKHRGAGTYSYSYNNGHLIPPLIPPPQHTKPGRGWRKG